MHDKEIGGRKIAVNEDRPQERRERPAFGGGGDRGGDPTERSLTMRDG